jgi:cytochrome c-type biogenesis protein CcmH/NrfG
MNKIKPISILISCFFSVAVIAEIPATAKYQSAGMASSGQSHESLNAAHKGINSKIPEPFWSAQQNKQAAFEAKMLKGIKENPEEKSNYVNLANLYLANNKTKKAIGAYQEAINHDNSNAKLFAGLSIAYLHQSKYSMAKAMAEQAVELDPEMKHAKKIKEYIIAKEEIIAQASQKKTMPTDSTHMKTTH